MPSYTQTKRAMGVTTPLGADVLLLRGMTAHEGISTLFELQLDLLSENHQIRAEDLLGQPVTVRLELQDGRGKRYFNGLVSRFEHSGAPVALGNYGNFSTYRATLVPWLWFLTRRSDCRMFQGKTVPEIIMDVFREAGFSDFDTRLTATYRSSEYCVQYRETDFNFVSRLMEQEGIYYFFKHTNGKHELILGDSYNAHETFSGYEHVPYRGIGLGAMPSLREDNFISDWSVATSVRSGRYTHKDFDFEKPRADLRAVATVTRRHARADNELYEYPGGYTETRPGDDYARTRIEETQTDYERVQGACFARGLSAGYLFSLTDHPRSDQNRECLIVSAVHELTSDEFATSGAAAASAPVYRGSFTAMDSQVPFRPPRVTPKPVVQGPQTAIVVGKQGEEIWTDKYGRVKVKFHWDRSEEQHENSSCWLRVATSWAGKNWGAVAIPRIGQEVVVQFLEGDPDRPLVIGSVYNADQMPPYELPGNQTRSGVKSRSSKGGGSASFNELRFEDKKGAEAVYFHAEKDFHRVVEHDDDLKVGNDQTIEIQQNRTKILEMGSETVKIKKGNRDVELGMGNDDLVLKLGNLSTILKMGNQTTKLDLGKSSTQALQSIELTVGQSSVKVDQMGVTIKGMMIKVEGSMMTEVKGMMTTIQGSAMLRLSGGITMIG
jgi:type VI secretion system secreted protein VgrG